MVRFSNGYRQLEHERPREAVERLAALGPAGLDEAPQDGIAAGAELDRAGDRLLARGSLRDLLG